MLPCPVVGKKASSSSSRASAKGKKNSSQENESPKSNQSPLKNQQQQSLDYGSIGSPFKSSTSPSTSSPLRRAPKEKERTKERNLTLQQLENYVLPENDKKKYLLACTSYYMRLNARCIDIAHGLRHMNQSGNQAEHYYLLKCFPCKTAQICGMVVGCDVRNRKLTYFVDDGTFALECHIFLSCSENIDNVDIVPNGKIVRVTGRIQENWISKCNGEKQHDLLVDSLDLCHVNDESEHLLRASLLHKKFYARPKRISKWIARACLEKQQQSGLQLTQDVDSAQTNDQKLSDPRRIHRSSLVPQLLRSYILEALTKASPDPLSLTELRQNRTLAILAERISRNANLKSTQRWPEKEKEKGNENIDCMPTSAQQPTPLVNEEAISKLFRDAIRALHSEGSIFSVPPQSPTPDNDFFTTQMSLDDQIAINWRLDGYSTKVQEEYYALPTVDNVGQTILNILSDPERERRRERGQKTDKSSSRALQLDRITAFVRAAGDGEYERISENTVGLILTQLVKLDKVESLWVGFYNLCS